MADNTTLASGTGGDTIRDVQKGGASGPKTQVVIVDAGGGGAESLLAHGQATMANSLPVAIASDQGSLPVSGTFWQLTQPVSGTVTAYLEGFNGTTWDRLSSTTANGLQVDVTRVQGAVGVTGSVTANAGTGTFTVGGTVQPGNTQNTTPWLVAQAPQTSGGLGLPYTTISTAAVTAANVKASAGQVYKVAFFNNGSGPAYVRLYDETTVPAATDTPVYRAMIPAGGGFVDEIDLGCGFGIGIGIRITGAASDNDATALAANQVMGQVFYR